MIDLDVLIAFGKIPMLELVKDTPAFLAFKGNLVKLVLSYVATGHPIDEAQYYLVFDVYNTYRSLFSAEDQKTINTWILVIARGQIKTFNDGVNTKNNWQTHRIKTVACAASVIKNDELYTWAYTQIYNHIASNLFPDGSCYDWKERDSVSYVTYNLVAFLMAIGYLKTKYVDDFYNYESPLGSSIKKSVHWVIPYIEGKETNVMFMKSTVFTDQYKAGKGKLWQKDDAKNMIRLAKACDPSLEAVWKAHFI